MEAELTLTITEQAPLEAVGAAVRGCAMGNGLDAERATRLQVVVEELCREARLREEVDGDGDLDISVSFDGSTITVEVVDQRLPLTSLESRRLPSRRLLGLGFVDQLHVHFNGDDDLGRFEQQLASLLGDRVGQDLLLLEVEGQLSLQGQHQFDLILEQLEARLLRLKRRGHPQISADDNEVSDMTQRPGDPLIARVAAQLQQRLEAPQGEGDPAVARLALAELHRLVR